MDKASQKFCSFQSFHFVVNIYVNDICVQSLNADLAATKLETQVTRNDILHRQNVSQGRDKYKTLKQIRQGNTKQRVDMFEAM